MADERCPPAPAGGTAVAITAEPGTTWSISGQYATSSTTPWGTNARGQTYRQCNLKGCPDLLGAQATNGKLGYVLNSQFGTFQRSGYIPDFESDGTTIIGKFSIGVPQDKLSK